MTSLVEANTCMQQSACKMLNKLQQIKQNCSNQFEGFMQSSVSNNLHVHNFRTIKKETTLLAKSVLTEEADTCDERTRIMGLSENKQNENKVDQSSNDESSSEGLKDNQMVKIPSYFLQVQEISVIFQQPNQSTVKQQRDQSHARIKPYEQKLRKKISNSEQAAKNLKQSQLMLTSRIFIADQENQLKSKCAYIWDMHVGLGSTKIPISEITKIKCLLEAAAGGQRKIKIVQNYASNFYFSSSTQIPANSQCLFCEHYLWFSKVITNKMQQVKYLLKNSNLTGKGPQNVVRTNVIIQGLIYKKSRYLCNWEPRYIILTQQELCSYKDTNQLPTYRINSQDVKYIWTRFDIYSGQLVIKMKHGLTQTQFAIPVIDFCSKIAGNWLYAFYRFMIHDKQYC